MGDRGVTALVSIITAIIGVSIVAVLVSNQAQTGNVLTAGGNALSGVLKAAVSPVSGGGLTGGVSPSNFSL